jgi:hypothetical protein
VSESTEAVKLKVKYLNEMLKSKGVNVCLLKLTGERALIYVFRPSRLKRDLDSEEARALLRKNGYDENNLCEIIRHLMGRINNCAEFPHEIGLFLGYPIEDIEGFIANKGKNCICTGCWKVYCNECEALKTFEKFKKCTDIYCRKLSEGLSIMRLTVAA